MVVDIKIESGIDLYIWHNFISATKFLSSSIIVNMIALYEHVVQLNFSISC